jgi:hypothetical protein
LNDFAEIGTTLRKVNVHRNGAGLAMRCIAARGRAAFVRSILKRPKGLKRGRYCVEIFCVGLSCDTGLVCPVVPDGLAFVGFVWLLAGAAAGFGLLATG